MNDERPELYRETRWPPGVARRVKPTGVYLDPMRPIRTPVERPRIADRDWSSLALFEQARRAAMPYTFEPMLATRIEQPFSHDDWLFERKLDGIRLLVFRDGAHVEIYTRNGKPRNARFPELVALFAAQPGERFVLDGEVVAFSDGLSEFAPLHPAPGAVDPATAPARGTDLCFYVFDCPWIEGYDIRRLALRDRKRVISQALDFSGRLCFTTHCDGDGRGFFAEARRRGWEGVIAKQADSIYRTGRSKRWLKLKCHPGQEFVIGGFTASTDDANTLDALLVGYYEGQTLRYAGRVDAGFDADERRRLGRSLAAIERCEPAFADAPGVFGARWVEPERVAALAFGEWRDDGLYRARYLGERDDKDAADIVRE